jgi:hypothetical protein
MRLHTPLKKQAIIVSIAVASVLGSACGHEATNSRHATTEQPTKEAPLVDTRVTLEFDNPPTANSTARLLIRMKNDASYTWTPAGSIQRKDAAGAWVDVWKVASPINDPAPEHATHTRPGEDAGGGGRFSMGSAWFGDGFQMIAIPDLPNGEYRVAKVFVNEYRRIRAFVEFSI